MSVERCANQTETSAQLRQLGSFKDYLLVLDSIRSQIGEQQQELKFTSSDFFKVKEDNNESDFCQYLKLIDDYLVSAVSLTQFKNLPLKGDSGLMQLLNVCVKYSSRSSVNQQKNWLAIVENLTDYRENWKYTQELLQIIIDNFEKNVLARLKQLSVIEFLDINRETIDSEDFQAQIIRYLNEIVLLVNNFRLIIISGRTDLNNNLISTSVLTDSLTKNCSIDKYPILLVIPDLISKVESLFRLSKMWLDTEELFLYQIRQQIREIKLQTKERHLKIAGQRHNHSRLLKEMRSSYLACQNNKRRMDEIKRQLADLNEQILLSKDEYEKKKSQKTHTENMVEFLEISITQTKRNYGLQLKRQQLRREAGELQTGIAGLQSTIEQLTSRLDSVCVAAETVANKTARDEGLLTRVRFELDEYSRGMLDIRAELEVLRRTLARLQSIETLKTSPEFVEQLQHPGGGAEPSSATEVVLAPSLVQRINNAKKMQQLHS